MNDVLVHLRNVSFGYEPGHPVLEQVRLDLRRGQRLALIGPNGSGKTSLLHLIVGLLRPAAGEIEAFGKVRKTQHDFCEVRRRAGLLFQDPEDQLFCPTVVEDVAFGPLNLGMSRDEALAVASETLDSLGLSGYEHRITYKLSTGEKRLVSLATVLAMKPEVLLLDEPTCGLDTDTEQRITQLLTALPQAMIIVSHERDFLAQVTEQSVRLEDGRLAE